MIELQFYVTGKVRDRKYSKNVRGFEKSAGQESDSRKLKNDKALYLNPFISFTPQQAIDSRSASDVASFCLILYLSPVTNYDDMTTGNLDQSQNMH